MSSDENEVLKFMKLSDNAKCPTRASKLAAGFDLYAANDQVVLSYSNARINTDISLAIPKNCYGRIAPRSGLALHHHIIIGGGVCDADFRGNLAIILFNLSSTDFIVNKGDRIAQLIIEKISMCNAYEVKSLDLTERNRNGFGSTGNQ